MIPGNARPLVSVIIPAFNAQAFIRTAIDSVLSQTYSSIQLVVVDDGSTDATAEILRSYGSALVWLSQANSGQSYAINRAFSMCRGELISYLGADDRLHPRAIEELARNLLSASDVTLVYPDFRLIDQDGNPIRQVSASNYNQHSLIAKFQCLPGPGAVVRRDAWAQAGGWSIWFRQIPDLDFYFRLSLSGRFLRVPECLADFRVHSGSTTHGSSSPEMAREPTDLVRSFFSRPNLPSEVLSWETEAYANSLLLSGYLHASGGRAWLSFKCFARSLRIQPRGLFGRLFTSYFLRGLGRMVRFKLYRRHELPR